MITPSPSSLARARKRGNANSHGKRRKYFVGDRYGKLVIVKYLSGSQVRCKCDCGNDADIWTGNLAKGTATSCGCDKADHRAYLRNQPCLLAEVWK